MSRKFYIRTFGCQMNSYDSDRVAALLIARGWKATEQESEADLLIVNSCSVREKPLQKVFSTVGRFAPFKRERKNVKIFVMGCVAQQLGDDIISRSKLVDAVFGPGQEFLIPDAADGAELPTVLTDKESLHKQELFPEQSLFSPYETHTAFVTVMHGCNNFCSYCIVPFVRGKEVSRKVSTIIKEIEKLVSQGIREVTLLGQNVNSYKDDSDSADFTDLLYRVAEIPHLDRIRFVTSHPKDFGEKLARAFADIPKLMPYLHLPAQSGDNTILEVMRRGYTREQYLDKLRFVRSLVPDIGLSSDFIVGFPGETEKQFNQTISLIEEVRYDSLFAFAYSPRPGTKAAQMKETIETAEKLRRLNRLLDVQKQIVKDVRSRFLGRKLPVMVDGPSPKGNTLMGRTPHNIITHFPAVSGFEKGSITTVTITEILDNTMRGSL